MKKRLKPHYVVGVVVAICITLAFPWLLVVWFIVGCIAFNIGKERGDGKNRAAQNTPLSQAVNNDLRIMNDCLHIINTSANVETVINRYNDLLAVLARLSGYEGNPAVSFQRELPSAALERIRREKPDIMNRAIQRAYDDTLHKCAALKTEKGRSSRHLKFFALLDFLSPSFPPETLAFAATFRAKNINDPLTGLEGL